MCHVAGKVDASDSVGTSGRKGRESAEAFTSRMGTLGLRRLGVGSGVKAWPSKGLNVVARSAPAGNGSSWGAEVVLLAAWAGLGGQRGRWGFLLWRQKGISHGMELGKLRPDGSGMWGMQGTLTLPSGSRDWGPVTTETDPRCA